MFCRHDWEEPELLNVTQPLRPGTKITNASVELIQKALWGFTTYTQNCKKCNKVRSYEVTGLPPTQEESAKI
jgi:hypothetical protein